MPRPVLATLPIAVLQAELARRVKKATRKLAKLIHQRARLDRAIEELQSMTKGTPKCLVKAAPAPFRRGPKPKAKRAMRKPMFSHICACPFFPALRKCRSRIMS